VRMDARRVLVVLGVVALIAGAVIGFLPIKVDGVKCGSAFISSDDAHVAALSDAMSGGQIGSASAEGDCDSKRSDWRIPAIALLVVGAGLGVGSLFIGGQRPTGTPPIAA